VPKLINYEKMRVFCCKILGKRYKVTSETTARMNPAIVGLRRVLKITVYLHQNNK